jgi:hypothetical protein
LNAVYDTIFAIVFIGIMFVWAVAVVPSMNFNNMQATDQQQLRNMELNVFNAMLLNSGNGMNGSSTTVNWGSMDPFSENAVTQFGLAGSTEGAIYSLDPDKVQRLFKDNPLGHISYDRTKQLLGLESYGFMFQIVPPFNVTNADENRTRIDEEHTPIDTTLLDQGILSYSIRVSYLDGRPIPNADVEASVVYTIERTVYTPILSSTKTDPLGINRHSESLAGPPGSIMVVLRISVADVATIVVTFGGTSNNVLDINMVGDRVVLTEPKIPSNAAVWLENMYYYGGDGSINHIYEGTQDDKINSGAGGSAVWDKNFKGLKNLNPVVIILEVSAVENDGEGHGRRDMIIAGPYQNFQGYTVFEFGSSYQNLDVTVRTQRSVVISGMTYTAEMVLWKEGS